MRHAATTLVTIAFLVLTTALPSQAAEPRAYDASPIEDVSRGVVSSPAAHLIVGLFATTVQLGVYGGCLALGGDPSQCIVRADNAGRMAVGRETVR